MKKKKMVKKTAAKKTAMPAMKAEVKKAVAKSSASTPFQWLLVIYALFFLAHVAIIALASSFFPSSVVLGTHLLSPLSSLLYSMGVFTLITVGAMPVIEGLSASMNLKLKDMHWMVLYYVINFVGLWLVARFAEMLGMGLANWSVAAVLALVIDIAQGLIIKNMPSDMN